MCRPLLPLDRRVEMAPSARDALKAYVESILSIRDVWHLTSILERLELLVFECATSMSAGCVSPRWQYRSAIKQRGGDFSTLRDLLHSQLKQVVFIGHPSHVHEMSLGFTSPMGGPMGGPMVAVDPVGLALLLGSYTRAAGGALELCILNCSHSVPLARQLIVAGVPAVMSWSTGLVSDAATTFVQAFMEYMECVNSDPTQAFDQACIRISLATRVGTVASGRAGRVPLFVLRDPGAPTEVSMFRFSPAPVAVGIPSLLQLQPRHPEPPRLRGHFASGGTLITVEPSVSASGKETHCNIVSLNSDLTLVALNCLGMAQHAKAFLQAGFGMAQGFLSMLVLSPDDLQDGMQLWSHEMEGRLPGLSTSEHALLVQLIEGANRKSSAHDEPPPFYHLLAYGVEQLLWMTLELAGDDCVQYLKSDLKILRLRGVGFSVRLDANLPAASDEREMLRQRFETELQQVIPHASIQALHGGSIVLTCWCPANVMDILAVLPADLVILARRLRVEGAIFAGHKVLSFPCGSPSPRVDCYDMELRTSPNAAAALKRLECLNALVKIPEQREEVALRPVGQTAGEVLERSMDRAHSGEAGDASNLQHSSIPELALRVEDNLYEGIASKARQGRGLRAGRGASAKLIDFLFNPKTWRNSPDKLPHEKSGRHGQKTGGHFLWLVRQVCKHVHTRVAPLTVTKKNQPHP